MTDKLELILHKNPTGKMELWACRGEGKGCPRNKYRKSKTLCDDCMGPLPEHWTVGEAVEKLKTFNKFLSGSNDD